MANDTLTSLTVLADKPVGISFTVDKKTLTPHVKGFDKVLAENKEVYNALAAYEYDGTGEERKTNSKFLAAVRKRQKAIKDAAKAFKAEQFAEFDAQMAELNMSAEDIIALADERKKLSDTQFKDNRTNVLVDAFEQSAVLYDYLDGLSSDDFIESKMLNRTTTEKNALSLLNTNIENFGRACEMNITPNWSKRELAQSLSINDWDVMNTIAAYNDEMLAREQQEALAAARKAEQELKAARMASRTIRKYSIANSDLAKFEQLLVDNKIDFEVVE